MEQAAVALFRQPTIRSTKLRRDLQMSATSNPAESEFSKGSLPVKKPLVEKLAIDPANLRNDQPQSELPRLGRRFLLAVASITFCIGAAATLTWQAYGDAARKTIASSFPQLGWLAPRSAPVEQNTPAIPAPAAAAPFPDQQQLTAMALDLDAVR